MDINRFKSMYKSLSPFYNADLNLLFPQPVLPSELPFEQLNNPLGAELYRSGSSSNSVPAGFDGQTPNYEDPSGGLQNPVAVSDNIVANEGLNVMNQPEINCVNKTRSKKNRGIEYMWCDACNAMCNGKIVWETHLLGKKHRKKTQVLSQVIEISSIAFGEVLDTKRQKLEKGDAR